MGDRRGVGSVVGEPGVAEHLQPLGMEVNVFMDKSFAPDPGGLHQMLQAGEAAEKKNFKVASGLICRHSVARQALIEKIRDGQLGDIQLIRAYRVGGRRRLKPRDPDQNELEWQIRRSVVHSGLIITRDQMLASRFCPYVDDLDYDSPTLLHDDEDGRYSAPAPGQWTEV